ncbi:hypothetical protein HOT49_gp092 [Erwinia phage vB_EamM_Alexandra]|uniref:Uncharacterized protein n=1 Tax=Erwinia phage vB_EamM_Alexandra TaxID=2201424 RepID=A0A2Z4QDP7_9CAUD|nr:hypothetical protein HOT49_gp092 [Erwinia phage vB_EamM_Alexandra]AWY08368.1 hypothetical protein Alexandra_92 [Erwinia phage vB_EamM_Alexandra]
MLFVSTGAIKMRNDIPIARKSLFMFDQIDMSQIKSGLDWVGACQKAKSCAWSNDGQTVNCMQASGVKDNKYYPALSGALREFQTPPSGYNMLFDDTLNGDGLDMSWRAVRQCSVYGRDESTVKYPEGKGSNIRAEVSDSETNQYFKPRYAYIHPDFMGANISYYSFVPAQGVPTSSSSSNVTTKTNWCTMSWKQDGTYTKGAKEESNPLTANVPYAFLSDTGQMRNAAILGIVPRMSRSQVIFPNVWYYVYNGPMTNFKCSTHMYGQISGTVANTPDYRLTKAACPVFNGISFMCEVFDVGDGTADITQDADCVVGQQFSLSIKDIPLPVIADTYHL